MMTQDSTKMLKDINEASWLSKPHVHLKDPKNVIEKINCIIQGGSKKLQVIFDFDRTLTKHHENGVVALSSYELLETMPTIPEGWSECSRASVAKYRPVETDPKLSMEEKIPIMLEWWTLGCELLKKIQWDLEIVDKHIRDNQQPLRDGTKACFEQLQSAKVPVLVFSAGIGDVVQMTLSHRGLLTPNVHIISNFLKIEDGKVVGYVDDNIIHVFNKNELLIKDTPYYQELSGRSNVILLGDSTGDALMADGVPHEIVLKIGFLNTNIEESLSQFMDLFDIVLTDDQTMDVLHQILNSVV
uniref:5'-nucleotidase n=1 Tax=Graphocephala atropunctata TaxID=36148 RepID=A0A1B6MFL6_9HEMI